MLSSRCCAFVLLFVCVLSAPAPETRPVGVQPDGKIIVPTNQILEPAGKQVTFPGRPVDLAFVDDKTLVVKNMRELTFIDATTGKVRSRLASPVGFSVVGLLAERDRIWVTDVQNHIRVADRQKSGEWAWGEPIALEKPAKGAAFPAGLMKLGDDLWVASSRGNSVQRIDRTSGKVKEVIRVARPTLATGAATIRARLTRVPRPRELWCESIPEPASPIMGASRSSKRW
jgi:hypothetical protein